jgi:hypothetical protein
VLSHFRTDMRTRALHRIQQQKNRNRQRVKRMKSQNYSKGLELQRVQRIEMKVLEEVQQPQLQFLKNKNKKLRSENVALKKEITKMKIRSFSIVTIQKKTSPKSNLKNCHLNKNYSMKY